MTDDNNDVKNPPEKVGPGLQVIHASLPRMGTQSLSRAYRQLGYRTHHCLDDLINQPWIQLERAFEASYFPSSSSPPFTTKDFDSLFGSSFDIVTDLASYLVPQLISAYPEAPVVIVKRDFESWYPSWKTVCVDHLFHHWSEPWRGRVMWYCFGLRSIQAMNKGVLGFLGVDSAEEINKEVVRRAYEGYYEKIREMVPEERRLEFRVGQDGWEELCGFLGRDVPDVPFPRMNDRKTYVENHEKSQQKLAQSISKIGLGLTLIVAVGVAVYRTGDWPISW